MRLGLHFFAIMRLSFRRTEARSDLNSGERPRAQREKSTATADSTAASVAATKCPAPMKAPRKPSIPYVNGSIRVTAASGAGRFDSG